MCFWNGILLSTLLICNGMICLYYMNGPPFVDWKFQKLFQQSTIDDLLLFDFKNAIIVNKTDFDFENNITFYYHKEFKQENLPLAYVGRDYSNSSMYTHINTFENEVVSIYHIRSGYFANAFIGCGNQIIDFYLMPAYNPDYCHKYRFQTKYGFEYAICALSRYEDKFGHLISDIIGPLLHVPDYIWDLEPVLCIQSVPIVLIREYMNIIGHGNIKIIHPQYTTVFAENLYVVQGAESVNPCGFHSLPILRKKIVDYYNLSSIKPEKYAYMNKDRSYRRLRNMAQIISTIENNTNLKFKHLYVNIPNRSDFAREMASLRIFIVVCGSQAYNTIFMKEKMGFLTLNSLEFDGPNAKLALDLDLWNIQVTHINIGHYGRSGLGNITRALYSFKVLSSAVENQKWPPNYLFSPINLNVIRKNVGDPYNFSLELTLFVHDEYEKYLEQQVNNSVL